MVNAAFHHIPHNKRVEHDKLKARVAELERRNEELEAAPLERHVLNEARIAELENKHCPWCNPRRPENNDE
jgi:hypothetical protein